MELAILTRNCPICGRKQSVQIDRADYGAYLMGKPIHEAFPYLSADEREIFLSGICAPCWDDAFGEDEE